ncbi:MAG TPA: HAMP domain-containing sensor histidine kinase [Streptosporangiaceae bacterium]|jgi:signal transduction histidine kinase
MSRASRPGRTSQAGRTRQASQRSRWSRRAELGPDDDPGPRARDRPADPARPPEGTRPRRAPAVRVAAVATLIVAVLYVAVMAIFNVIADGRLVAQVDAQLRGTLRVIQDGDGFATAILPDGDDKNVGTPPVLLWEISESGRALRHSANAPQLPPTAWLRSGQPHTARLGDARFRLKARQVGNVWLVAGQSLFNTEHIEDVLLAAEAVAGPVFLAVVFLGTLTVGLKASGPVELARRRQLEFTADASHELRTPLSVIEAEVGLALSTRREAAQYTDALRRVGREGQRLRGIVDDLLWLARFDSEPTNPGNEPVDLATIAGVCADRFSAIARSRGIDLSVRSEGEPQAWITAPPEWVDRLTGVLVDNACRYAAAPRPAGDPQDSPVLAVPAAAPAVRIVVAAQGGRISLTVEDTGPGIPEDQRARLFDRFYRVTADPGGSGLGLAIADAVVRSTGGKWRVDDSPLGGARMQVTWHRSASRPGSGRPFRRKAAVPG